VEMGLALAGVPFRRGGVEAALTSLCERANASQDNSQPPTPTSQGERLISNG
jgi:hypothetical protein